MRGRHGWRGRHSSDGNSSFGHEYRRIDRLSDQCARNRRVRSRSVVVLNDWDVAEMQHTLVESQDVHRAAARRYD